MAIIRLIENTLSMQGKNSVNGALLQEKSEIHFHGWQKVMPAQVVETERFPIKKTAHIDAITKEVMR